MLKPLRKTRKHLGPKGRFIEQFFEKKFACENILAIPDEKRSAVMGLLPFKKEVFKKVF
ncbi:MAG: hypothetical protein CM15mP4_0650 [Candidatus Neomarinimicrobiota bacterium]|nr:MAG: hypothetical protein CM15mP4_0650 [Candidatus Neomarinimicrobiota bacterium]